MKYLYRRITDWFMLRYYPKAYWKAVVEAFWMQLAWMLPKRVAYYTYARVHSHATVTTFQDRTPDQVSWLDALESWDNQTA